MPAAYEYKILTNVQKLPDFSAPAKMEPGAVLTAMMVRPTENLSQALLTLDGGGWELISHSVVPHGDMLILTFLVRRPAR